MQPFTRHTGLALPLLRSNVDTDQIIPKEFLKRIERTGFEDVLFADWRYFADGELNPAFALNDVRYHGATILLTGRNFGCGSSREHAVWALHDYGFRAIIAPSYADIFYANCFNNGLLPITLPEAEVELLAGSAAARPGYTLTIDLEACSIADGDLSLSFDLDSFLRHRLLHGLDDIGLTLQHKEDIAAYERHLQPLVSSQ